MSPYRTLIVGVLRQDSAFVVGGSGDVGLADRLAARDGHGRLVIPGRGIAGALIAMARRFYDPLPRTISAGLPTEKPDAHPLRSVWRPFNAYPIADTPLPGEHWSWLTTAPRTELRQGVAINHQTGARKGGALYDTECVPVGTRWSFLLEIDTERGGAEAEDIAVRVLSHWRQGRCWLGGDVARGLGWMHLDDVRLARVPATAAWPNATKHLPEVVHELVSAPGVLQDVTFEDAVEFGVPTTKSWCFGELTGTIIVGKRAPDEQGRVYGLDALTVGGHAAGANLHFDETHWVKPTSVDATTFGADFATDKVIALATDRDGTNPSPFIPGSGIRGPLRHALARRERAAAQAVATPKTDKLFGNDPVAAGKDTRSALVLVRDAYLVPDKPWKAARLQHHAEDEFTAGPYASSKFDQTTVLEATLAWRIVVEGPTAAEVNDLLAELGAVLGGPSSLATHGHLPLGSGKWRGQGWVGWTAETATIVDTLAQAQLPAAAPVPEPAPGTRRQRWQPPATSEQRKSLSIKPGQTPRPLTGAEVNAALVAAGITPSSWWVEPVPDIGRPGRLTTLGWGELAAALNGVQLTEVRVGHATGTWHAVASRGGYRFVDVRESAEGTAALVKSYAVLARSDMARFGLQEIARDGRKLTNLRVTEYHANDTIVGFRWEA